MSSRAMRNALDWVRLTLRENEAAALSDAQLLEAFLEVRDEIAFAAIVRRHGPMVLGVCKRFLKNHHDAEDAFQAVFLVFMKRADSIRPKSHLANWLYGVAFKTACKTRAYLGKRRLREWSVASVPDRGESENQEWDDFWLLLDQELNQLPDKYRAPIVLCDLEGKSRREAAHALGVLDGTLSGRLARARRRLATRLSRRGVSLSGAAVAATLLHGTASASLPTGLVAATTKTAFALACKGSLLAGSGTLGISSIAKGVLHSMFIAKVWQTSAVLVFSTLVVGAGAGVMTVRGGVGGDFVQSAKGDEPKGPAQEAGQAKTDVYRWPARDKHAQERIEHFNLLRNRLRRDGIWQESWKEFMAGRGTMDSLLKCSSELMETDLLLANNTAERLLACQAQLNRITPIVDLTFKRFESGKKVDQDWALVKGAYEQAISRVQSELKAEPVSKPTADARVSSDELIHDLVAAAKEEWQARLNEYSAGRGIQTFLLAASKRLKEAELKKAAGPDARLEALKAHFNRTCVIYNIANGRFEAGKISIADLQEANYARIEAELDVAEVGSKKSSSSVSPPVEKPSPTLRR